MTAVCYIVPVDAGKLIYHFNHCLCHCEEVSFVCL